MEHPITKYLESVSGAATELIDDHRHLILDVIRNVRFERQLYEDAFNHLRGNPHNPLAVLEGLVEAAKYGIICSLKTESDPPEPNECPHCRQPCEPRTQRALVEGEEREVYFCQSCNHEWGF